MAWKYKDNRDGCVYPIHRGEYVGNYLRGGCPPTLLDESQEEACKRLELLLSKMRFGKPRECEAFTTEEGEQQEWIGLYLLEDGKLPPDAEPVLTPPELMEPGQEFTYNRDGIPGMMNLQIKDKPIEFSESLECKTFDDGAFIIADGPVDELSSCIIAARNASPTPELSCAYARLFTAAPKLLKLAEELVSAWEANEQAFDELEREIVEPLYLKAKEAIQGIRQPSQ